MKKIFFAFLIIAIAMTTHVSAQDRTFDDEVWNQPLRGYTMFLVEGQNSMILKQGQGTVQFTKAGDRFSNIVFLDSAGLRHILSAVPAGTNGLPRPECKNPLANACFVTADKNVGLCICKPNDLSKGYSVSVYYVKKHLANIKYND